MIEYKGLGIIGDVHAGRRFEIGVPLARRGERERLVMRQFGAELDRLENDGIKAIVQVGDIFDKFRVSNEVVTEVADAIELRARRWIDKMIFIMRGNHDASRDFEKISSFTILQRMLADQPNVVFISSASGHEYLNGMHIGFVPWHPLKTAAEMVDDLEEDPYDVIFGHWDVLDFGEDNPNVIPVEALKKKTKKVFTGHDHNARDRTLDGLDVTVTGSMQPYSHGEDKHGFMYVTMTLAELEKIEPAVVKDKCIRVLLEDGETLPDDIDCLQLTAKRVSSSEEEDTTVELGDFDMEGLFYEAFQEAAVSDDVMAEMLEKFHAERAA